MTRFHRGFGLVFASDLPLSGFAEADPPDGGAAAADVAIRTGDAARAQCDAAGIGREGIRPAPDGGYVFRAAGTCDYWAANPGEIHLSPAPGAPEGHIMLFLTGSVIGMILHLRGVHSLHAATVARGGVAIAFIGDQGAGKSTLAAAMARPGQTRSAERSAPPQDPGVEILGDDVIALEATEAEIRAHPGAVKFKLWQDTLDHFGMIGEEAIMNRTEKFFTPSPLPVGAPAPLGAVVLLERGPEDGDIRAERLTPAAAVDLIMRHGYRTEYVRALGRMESHFRQSATIAARLPVWRLTRPHGLEHLDATSAWLETRWDELTAPHEQSRLRSRSPNA